MKKNNFILLILLLVVQFSWAQLIPREIVRGQIISDSSVVERVTIFNKSSNKGAVSDDFGYFTMYARPTDTLVFSSVVFKPAILVLTDLDFKVNVMKIKLDVFVNELDEVIVTPNSLSGDLVKDNRNLKVAVIDPKTDSKQAIIDTKYELDAQSTLKNTAMPSDGSIQYGMDFVRIGKDVLKLFDKKEGTKEISYASDKIFQEVVKEKFTYYFFTETLGLKHEEIGLFLGYCENDPKVKALLAPDKEIELIDFLIFKSDEYKKLPKK
jgi:hypothetical protein